MDVAKEYLKMFFKNYEYKITFEEKREYLYNLINNPLYTSFESLEPDEKEKLKNDASQFFFGFQHLESGRDYRYSQNTFHNELFFLLGNAVELYQRAQRNQDFKLCESAQVQIESFIKKYNEYLWFAEYKLGRIIFLTGNLAETHKISYYNDAIKTFNKVRKLSSHLPYSYNALGDVYLKKRRLMANKEQYSKRAIKNFNEARIIAATNGFDYVPAINGLGNANRKLNNYEEAIQLYKQALVIDPKFYFAQYYLGDCYRLQENHHEAEASYSKALKLNDKHPYCYYGLGRNHYELGNRSIVQEEKRCHYQKALDYFNDGINLDSDFPRLLREKARVLEKLKMYREAIEFYNQAAKLFFSRGYNYDFKTIQTTVKDLRKIIALEKKLDSTDPKDDTPCKSIIRKTIIDGIEEKSIDLKDSFEGVFLREIPEKKHLKKTSYLEVLKRWNSYTPIIGENSKGGGSFVQIRNKGIVIDPGYDFIKNFIAQGHKFDEIDTVLVSHSHGDHTADLESIISLLYRFNKKLKDDTIPREIAKERNCSTAHAKKHNRTEISQRYRDGKRKKQIDLYVSDGVFKKYESYFRADNECNLHLKPKDKLPAYNINIVTIVEKEIPGIGTAIPAFHKDILATTPPLGFFIDCGNDTVLIYTSDTGWTKREKNLEDIIKPTNINLKKEYYDLLSSRKYKDKRKILLAHLGGFDRKEKWLVTEDKSHFYKYHLGRLGLVELVQTVEPDLCIISEWGEEFRDLRVDISNSFKKAFNFKHIFIPADIGLKIDLNNHCVRAITKIDYTLQKIIYSKLEPKNVSVSENRTDNSIYYYYEKGDTLSPGVTEKQCYEALLDGFIKIDESTKIV